MTTDLLTIARATGLREHLHGVDATEARAILQRFVDSLPQSDSHEIARLRATLNDLGKIIHDLVVGQQAAWIEWQHGKGAEAAMAWIHNGLLGPGHIPDEDEPYGKEPQAWYDANRADPFPNCFCGRPSNIIWVGEGFCCEAHYQQRKAEIDAQKKEGQ